jgi:hypothetical protein
VQSFQITTDSLAESCYGDKMSYARGLRQLEARMSAPATLKSSTDANSVPNSQSQSQSQSQKLEQTLFRYGDDLKSLMFVNIDLTLDFPDLFERRLNRENHINAEPYDKVFWFVGQAVIVALLVTGPTLKQLPPDLDERFFLPFEFVWMENFHRNQERSERDLPPLEPIGPVEQ